MIDDNDRITPIGKRHHPCSRGRTGAGGGDQHRHRLGPPIGRQPVHDGLGLLGARQPDRPVLQLHPGHEGGLMGLDVWTQGDAGVCGPASHPGHVGLQEVDIAHQARCGNKSAGARLIEATVHDLGAAPSGQVDVERKGGGLGAQTQPGEPPTTSNDHNSEDTETGDPSAVGRPAPV